MSVVIERNDRIAVSVVSEEIFDNFLKTIFTSATLSSVDKIVYKNLPILVLLFVHVSSALL